MTPASVGFQCPDCVREGSAGVRAPRAARGNGLRRAAGQWGPVTLGLIAVNVALFVVTAIAAAFAGASPLNNYDDDLWRQLAQVPVLVQLGDWWRIVTAAFEHVGLVHLVLNMLALLVFGSELERALGRWRFLGVYLVSLLGGAAAIQLFSNPLQPVAGASTAIYGLLGALGVVLLARRQSLRGLVTLVVLNVIISVVVPGISIVGHLGGLVVGAAAAGVVVVARRRPALQAAGLVLLGVVLVVLALTAPVGSIAGY
jgi:membrane associated rhomboid family serine protease